MQNLFGQGGPSGISSSSEHWKDLTSVILSLHNVAEGSVEKSCQTGGKRKSSASEMPDQGKRAFAAVEEDPILNSALRRDGDRRPEQVFANGVIRELYDLTKRSGGLNDQGLMLLDLPFSDSHLKISRRYIGFDKKGGVRITNGRRQEDVNSDHLAEIVEHVANLYFFMPLCQWIEVLSVIIILWKRIQGLIAFALLKDWRQVKRRAYFRHYSQ
ncbi:MAG: hypothetical protein HON23_07445 [Rickettsiales bacterium]|nr:hypothetical protein [Rickettsiales bacterium]